MHGTDPSTGQHCFDSFGNHRHINNYAVTLADSIGPQHARYCGDTGLQFGKCKFGLGAGDRAVVDNRNLISSAIGNMPIHCIVTTVYLCVGKPFVQIFTFFE